MRYNHTEEEVEEAYRQGFNDGKDAACVEVKEGYGSCKGPRFAYGPDGELCPLSEALTLRTVEDVRREALEEAAEICSHWEGVFTKIKSETSPAYGAATCEREIRALIDTPAPSREECPECKGSGMRDSGGVHPWGEHIDVPCDCGEPQPTPSPESEPVAWQVKDFADGWITFDSKFKALDYAEPVSAHVRPLYASPPTPASHAEELRKAKEDAWDEGYQWAYDGMSQRNPYRRSTDEGGGK